MIAALIVAALFHSLLVNHVNGRAFKDLLYEDIEHQSKDLRSPFAHVKSAHELYGLSAAKAKVRNFSKCSFFPPPNNDSLCSFERMDLNVLHQLYV